MTPLRVLPAAHGRRKRRQQLFSSFPVLPTQGSTLQPPIPAHPNPECIDREHRESCNTRSVSHHCLWSLAALGFRGMLPAAAWGASGDHAWLHSWAAFFSKGRATHSLFFPPERSPKTLASRIGGSYSPCKPDQLKLP